MNVTDNSNNTIEIVTTNRRYKALRVDDPIWSGFLPDADVIGSDKEYHVSEEVSQAIDTQWDAYNRLLRYLNGIAYIELDRSEHVFVKGKKLMAIHTDDNGVSVLSGCFGPIP